jgi:putative aldouronate transport system substrate-binding protein
MVPKFWDAITEARKLYQDGILDPDTLAIKDYNAYVESGKAAVVIANDFGVNVQYEQALEKNVPGASYEAFTLFQRTPGRTVVNFQQWNFQCLATVSKNKERAVQFLDWTNSSQDIYDLIAYGIKGTDWEPVGDTQYNTLPNSGYPWFPYAWVWNPTQDRLSASFTQDDMANYQFCKVADNFTMDVLTGFSFDATPVKNELAMYATIEAKYYPAIMNGVVDPDTYWAKLKDEGAPYVKKIQVELQKQIDAFLASKQ